MRIFSSNIFKVLVIIMPWSIKRLILIKIYGYKIHRSARIGFSWVFPHFLEMKENTRIGHFTVGVHLDKIIMLESSKIGRKNWITGFTTKCKSKHFQHQRDRESKLFLGIHSAITKNHHLDCTDVISIGDFSTIAGYQTQFLTHSIDIIESRQSSKSISIGNYSFVGTNCTILGGSVLPDNCVLGAKSLLNKNYSEKFYLYGGIPSKPLSKIPVDAKYFHRKMGFVY